MVSYDLTLAAEGDLRAIWTYTYQTWGAEQADRYLDLIEACCAAIASDSTRSRQFEQLPDDVRIHRCEHHFIVWLGRARPIVIAVLHERMDCIRRLKDRL